MIKPLLATKEPLAPPILAELREAYNKKVNYSKFMKDYLEERNIQLAGRPLTPENLDSVILKIKENLKIRLSKIK